MDMGSSTCPSLWPPPVNIDPLLDAEHGQVGVVQASARTPSILKSSNIIYIGCSIVGPGAVPDSVLAMDAREAINPRGDQSDGQKP